MGFKLDPFCSRSFEHRQVPFGAGFVEAKNIQTIVAPDLDIAVVRSAPLIECFENIDSVPIEMKSPRHRHSVIRGMLFDLNAHDLGPSWSGRPTLLSNSELANDNKKSSSPSRDLALASPPSPLQTAAGCAAPLPSRRVARSLLAGGGRPSGFRPGRRRSASRRGLATTGPFARG